MINLNWYILSVFYSSFLSFCWHFFFFFFYLCWVSRSVPCRIPANTFDALLKRPLVILTRNEWKKKIVFQFHTDKFILFIYQWWKPIKNWLIEYFIKIYTAICKINVNKADHWVVTSDNWLNKYYMIIHYTMSLQHCIAKILINKYRNKWISKVSLWMRHWREIFLLHFK